MFKSVPQCMPETYSDDKTPYIMKHDSCPSIQFPIKNLDKITLDLMVERETSEGEVVVAIGSDNKYFALIFSLDNGVWVEQNGKTLTSGEIIASPLNHSSLLNPEYSTLLLQYNSDLNPRNSLSNNDKTRWDSLRAVDDKDTSLPPLNWVHIVVERINGTSKIMAATNIEFYGFTYYSDTFDDNEVLNAYVGADISGGDEAIKLNSMGQFMPPPTSKPTMSPTICSNMKTVTFDGTSMSSDEYIMVNDLCPALKIPVPYSENFANGAIDKLFFTVTFNAENINNAEADIFLMIGNNAKYIGASIAMDDEVVISGNHGDLAVIPKNGLPLLTTSNILNQYRQNSNQRLSISQNDISKWQFIADKSDNWGGINGEYSIEISIDKFVDDIDVKFKNPNGVFKRVTYADTFDDNEEINLYMGVDGINTEMIKISGVAINMAAIAAKSADLMKDSNNNGYIWVPYNAFEIMIGVCGLIVLLLLIIICLLICNSCTKNKKEYKKLNASEYTTEVQPINV